MNMLEEILDNHPDETFLKADGFDDAIIGLDEKSGRLIYSTTKCLEILVKDEEMTIEEAIEHFYYNVSGAYMGEQTPIFCTEY